MDSGQERCVENIYINYTVDFYTLIHKNLAMIIKSYINCLNNLIIIIH